MKDGYVTTAATNASRRWKRAEGFTLIEIMVVVIVLAIMASLIVPKFVGTTYDAKVSKAKSDIKTLQNCFERYYLNLDRYPTTEQGLDALLTPPSGTEDRWRGPYISDLEDDPWGRSYQYRSPGENNRDFDIWSQGSDGQDGGETQDADITSWKQESS